MLVQDRVDEADAAFADGVARLVDQRENAASCGRGGGGAIDEGEVAVDGDDVVCAVSLRRGGS